MTATPAAIYPAVYGCASRNAQRAPSVTDIAPVRAGGPTCSRSRCTSRAHRRGLCLHHYLLDPNRGYIDADVVRNHVAALHTAGLAWSEIAAAAGLTEKGLFYLRSQAVRTQVATARRIFAIPAATGHARIDACGAQRRVQALMVIGWPRREIASRSGVSRNQVTRIARHQQAVTAHTHVAISTLFDQLWDKPGPCERTRERARTYDWVPALAWDDIDDPAAQPDLGARQPVAFAERYLELVGLGERNEERIAQRLGITVDSLKDMCNQRGLERVS